MDVSARLQGLLELEELKKNEYSLTKGVRFCFLNVQSDGRGVRMRVNSHI